MQAKYPTNLIRILWIGEDGRVRTTVAVMPGFVLSQLLLRLISVVLGGYGIFCLLMSFALPWLGAQAFVLLGAAAIILYFSESGQPPR
jgi:hypothetical protein